MRRANVQLQADRRDEILVAAQACFARAGFHQTSMQEICSEAQMSPGNLYRYFRSKEDIIAAIAERDRAETAPQFAARVGVTAPERSEPFGRLTRHYERARFGATALSETEWQDVTLALDTLAAAR